MLILLYAECSDMTPIIARIEHIRMHEKHKGHEAMHAEMVLVLITALLLGQVVLVFWRKHHPRSYQVSQPCLMGRPWCVEGGGS